MTITPRIIMTRIQGCPACRDLQSVLDSLGVGYEILDIDDVGEIEFIQALRKFGATTTKAANIIIDRGGASTVYTVTQKRHARVSPILKFFAVNGVFLHGGNEL